MPERRTVALVTLGCARNEVDSEELAGRLAADGWELVENAADADVAVVNTCGFVEAAKKDSVDALLEANDLKEHGRTQAVVAVGCLAVVRFEATYRPITPFISNILFKDGNIVLELHQTARRT